MAHTRYLINMQVDLRHLELLHRQLAAEAERIRQVYGLPSGRKLAAETIEDLRALVDRDTLPVNQREGRKHPRAAFAAREPWGGDPRPY